MIDAPNQMVQAVNQALAVISWFENLPRDEVPPRHIWWSQELLDEWFVEVQERREKGASGRRSRSSYDEAKDVPMTTNEFADQFRPKG